jgi:signal peptidase II
MLRRYLPFAAIVLVVAGLDQWTKFLAVEHLTTGLHTAATLGQKLGKVYGEAPDPAQSGYHFRPTTGIELHPNFLRLRYAENPGAAWGLFRDVPANIRLPFFHVAHFAAMVFLTVFFARLKHTPEERWLTFALPLLLGGAMGNYVDRLARGFVIDFVEVHWFDLKHFPNFNVADAAISVGVTLLILDGLIRREKKEEPAPAVPELEKR